MRLLDLFCGGGGAAAGYIAAGFEVVGVDIAPQPHYPGQFIRGDALEFCTAHGQEFDLIHASPPCQEYTALKRLTKKNYPDLVAPTRACLLATGKPWIIENVPGAPLKNPVMLCGTMFGLRVFRHRLFETSWGEIMSPSACMHDGTINTFSSLARRNGRPNMNRLIRQKYISVVGNSFLQADGMIAMRMPHYLPSKQLAQAIPPAYTEYLGRRFLNL